MSDRENLEYDLSASRVKTHASCPEKYRQKYVLGNEPTKAKKGYGQMGSWVHLTIENVLTDKNIDTRTGKVRENGEPISQSVFQSKLKQEFFRLEDSDETETAAVTDDQRSTALECLQTAARFILKESTEVQAIEKKVHFSIDNPSIDRTAYGKIDVVTESGDIWDWKTGRVNPSFTPRDELIQGCIYMAGYHKEYGELPNSIKFVYLHPKARERTDSDDDGPCERTVDPSQDNWDEMIQYARRLVQDEATNDFVADPDSSKCYFCSFEMYCPASAVGVGGAVETIESEQSYDLWDAI